MLARRSCPAALLLSLSLMLYGMGGFDLVHLCFAFCMHLVIGWLYLFMSPHVSQPRPAAWRRKIRLRLSGDGCPDMNFQVRSPG